MIHWPTKGADEKISYGFDWRNEFEGLTISASIWVVVEGDVHISVPNVSGLFTMLRVTDGTPDTSAVIRNTITLSDGQQASEEAYLRIKPLDT